MASAFSHAFVAVAAGKMLPHGPMPAKFWWLSIACSVLPDADVLGYFIGVPYGHPLGHRGLTHSFSFALVLSLVVVTVCFGNLPARPPRRWLLTMHFFFVTASHGVLDAMTNGGLGIAFFAPFDDTRYFLPWRPVNVSPLEPHLFFTRYGLRVMISEFVWIWVPVALLWGSVRLSRTLRSRATTANETLKLW
jgi:inner membrane protein